MLFPQSRLIVEQFSKLMMGFLLLKPINWIHLGALNKETLLIMMEAIVHIHKHLDASGTTSINAPQSSLITHWASTL